MSVDAVYRYCNKSPITNFNIGLWIRSIHLVSPFFLIFISLFHSKLIAELTIYLMILKFSLFLLIGNCWISILENQLCNDSMCIVDLVIEGCGVDIYSCTAEKQDRLRFTFTYSVATLFFCSQLLIYYFRFMR